MWDPYANSNTAGRSGYPGPQPGPSQPVANGGGSGPSRSPPRPNFRYNVSNDGGNVYPGTNSNNPATVGRPISQSPQSSPSAMGMGRSSFENGATTSRTPLPPYEIGPAAMLTPPLAARGGPVAGPPSRAPNPGAFPAQFEQIRRDCRQQGTLFTDNTFPPTDSSLFFATPPPYPIQWLRPADITRPLNLQPVFETQGYQFCDLKQGELGDCWMVASLACLLVHDENRRNLFPRIVIPGQTFDPSWYCGAFCFRFWRFGKWHDVIVDDYLPTRNGRLVYVHSQQVNEFWSALLEKAYAKLNGSYEGLRGGLLPDAMDDLTGGLTESYTLQYNSPENNTLLPPKNIDDVLIKALDRQSLVGAGIKDNMPTVPISGTGRILPNGLVAGHAYTLTDTRKIRLTDDRGDRVVTLVRIRNPWNSEVEWNGPWSDNSPQWLSIPEQDRVNVGLVKGDGEFWMSMEDFLANFDSLDVCHLPPELHPSSARLWATYDFQGNWKTGVSAGGRPFFQDTFWTNPQYKVILTDSDALEKDGMCTCIIGLMQKDKRRLKKNGITMLSIGFVVYKLVTGQETVPLKREFFDRNNWAASVDFYVNCREVVKRLTLPPGAYVIVPSTYYANQEGEFLLRIFFENPQNKADTSAGRMQIVKPLRREMDSRLPNKMPNIRKIIANESGDRMSLDAYQLARVLNILLADDRYYSEITVNACKALVAMYDKDNNFRLDENDFPLLWNDIYTWLKAFRQYDVENSGTVDSMELRLLLEDMGFNIPPGVLQKIVHRFSGPDLLISYSNFIAVMATMMKTLDNFRRYDEGGKAKLTLDEFFNVGLSV